MTPTAEQIARVERMRDGLRQRAADARRIAPKPHPPGSVNWNPQRLALAESYEADANALTALLGAAPAAPRGALRLASAVSNLLEVCGVHGFVCGVSDAFDLESAIKMLDYATKLKRRAVGAAPRLREAERETIQHCVDWCAAPSDNFAKPWVRKLLAIIDRLGGEETS